MHIIKWTKINKHKCTDNTNIWNGRQAYGLRSDTDNLNLCSLSFCVAETLRGSEGAWSLWQPFSPPRGFWWSSPCLGHCWPPGQWEEHLRGDGRFDFGGQHLLHVFICLASAQQSPSWHSHSDLWFPRETTWDLVGSSGYCGEGGPVL